MTHAKDLCIICLRVDIPLQSVRSTCVREYTVKRTLYTSYVKMDDTAISSAEVALVTARNRRTNNAIAPDCPRIALAAAAAGNPAEMSAGESVRMDGSPRRATAASPRVVAKVNGMANLWTNDQRGVNFEQVVLGMRTYQANPPRRYALTVLPGLLAMARCQ